MPNGYVREFSEIIINSSILKKKKKKKNHNPCSRYFLKIIILTVDEYIGRRNQLPHNI